MDKFASLLLKTSKERNSKVILSADMNISDDWSSLRCTLRYDNSNFAAVKVHPELPQMCGMEHSEAIADIKELTGGLQVILDAKLADIDNSNRRKATFYFEEGYDA